MCDWGGMMTVANIESFLYINFLANYSQNCKIMRITLTFIYLIFFPFSHAKMLSEIDHEHDSSKLSK